jgi:tRNA (guanine26-N2/guanine27-N2)-dimethyltransferase
MAEGNEEAPRPGHLWLEGKTLVHLRADQDRPTHMPRGPAKRTGPGFLNPAMAPARTRSVLLLADALEHDWLVKQERELRALDALCATGVRVRRWRNEIPVQHQHRLRVSANDLDRFALDWLKHSHASFPPSVSVDHALEDDRYERDLNGEMDNGIFVMQTDARIALLESAYQWIDLDPFGSPVNFLDAAVQGLSRVGFLEVTATDTAALTGSSPGSQQRRYGAKGIVDSYAHDDAVRVLLGLVATTAARHDRAIEPVLALFDGHHVRISVKVRRSREGASTVLEQIGWRIRNENGTYRFVHHPTPEEVEHGSGPMWIGPMWDATIAGRLTVERALEVCTPSPNQLELAMSQGLVWDEHDSEYASREIRRSVRYISQAADLMSRDHTLYHMDDLPNMAGTGQAPKMEALFTALDSEGYAAARVPDIDPFFVTDAPFETVIAIVRQLSGPQE